MDVRGDRRREGLTLTVHVVIPDTQHRPGVPDDHLRWAGLYVAERRPDVVVHLGDHWDMPSLSSYDAGTKSMEGRRYAEDVKAGNEGLALLTAPTKKLNRSRRFRKTGEYSPRWVLLRGNHEDRIRRAIESNAQLDGAIGFHDLESPGWEVHDFLDIVWIDGVAYSHFFANKMTGRPLGGMVRTRLDKLGHSFTQGHVQTYDQAIRTVHGPNGPQMQRGLVAGAFYIADEDYRGVQGNGEWRGLIVKHEVRDGDYSLMEVSMDFLCRKFEGMPLRDFLRSKYPDMTGSLWA